MTQEQHPITPSDDHVKKWMRVGTMDIALFHLAQSLCTQAARWGADQELDACISAVLNHPGFEQPELFTELLHSARRPKPPSLKEQALTQTNAILNDPNRALLMEVRETLELNRRALEALPDD